MPLASAHTPPAQAETNFLNNTEQNPSLKMTDSQLGQFQATNFQRATQRIGSIRNGQYNYSKDQKYFEGERDHIRQGVSTVVKDVKDAIDKDTLGTKKPAWTQSVGIVGHPKPESHTKTLFEIKQGLQDEHPQKP